jgi:hypothetical protein
MMLYRIEWKSSLKQMLRKGYRPPELELTKTITAVYQRLIIAG